MMYEIPRLLSTAQAAEAADLAESSVRTYRTRGQVPPPDATIGSTPGWLPTTIEAWAATLPGKGARTDLPQPDADHPDLIGAAKAVLALIRSCTDTSAMTAPELQSPYRPDDLVRQASWAAAGHLARTTAAYEVLPWQALAADLGDLGDPDDADQARSLLLVVDEHLGRAQARLAERRPQPDWQDHLAVSAELEHVARRAAYLRMVAMLESVLAQHTGA